jgi:hypothetical protein
MPLALQLCLYRFLVALKGCLFCPAVSEVNIHDGLTDAAFFTGYEPIIAKKMRFKSRIQVNFYEKRGLKFSLSVP